MAFAQSRLSPQGQISVPVEVRKRLGLEPGSVIEWDEHNGDVVVRRGGGATWGDIRKRLFPEGPPAAVSLAELDEAIGGAVAAKHARR
jgi:AbrB family looped-hinge helix DNA binding protein